MQNSNYSKCHVGVPRRIFVRVMNGKTNIILPTFYSGSVCRITLIWIKNKDIHLKSFEVSIPNMVTISDLSLLYLN